MKPFITESLRALRVGEHVIFTNDVPKSSVYVAAHRLRISIRTGRWIGGYWVKRIGSLKKKETK